jgi:hypothetical protein
MQNFKQHFLSESPLNRPNFRDNPDRYQHFKAKIDAEGEFETLKGNKVALSKKNLKKLTNDPADIPKKLLTVDGEEINFNQLKKTKEFGSNPGSGGGAELTKLGESAQCVYNAVAFRFGNIKDATDFFDKVDKVKNMYDIDGDIEEIKTSLPTKWIESSIWTANLLSKMYKGNYISHRGSKQVDIIDKHFHKFNKAAGKPLSNLNKWNPADIWLLKKGFKPNFGGINNLLELNDYIGKLYNDGSMIGISLKKITSDKPPVQVYNTPDSKILTKYLSSTITTGNKGFLKDSMDVYMNFEYHGEQARIQFRSFGGKSLTGWQGEVKGTSANGGKIGGGGINKILRNKLTKSMNIAKLVKSKDEQFLKDFYTLGKEFYKFPRKYTYDVFKKNIKKVNDSYLYSKFAGLEMLKVFEKIKDKNSVITSILGYAMSASEHSSVFVKIGN